MIEFRVKGLPVALKRPRMTRRGIVYDPSKKEKQVFDLKCRKHRPEKAWTGPIKIEIIFYFKRPPSHIKKDLRLRKNAPEHHTAKPDIDNLVKFVLDALKGFYIDDRQIIVLKASKCYMYCVSSTYIKINKFES